MDYTLVSETCIKPAMKYLPVATVLLRGNGFVIDEINRVALHLLKIDRNVIGKTFLDVVPELQDQPAYTALQEIYRSKDSSVLQKNVDGFISIGHDKIHVQFNFQFIDQEEILLVIHPLKNGSSNGLTPRVNDLATSVIESAGLGTFDFDLAGNSFRSSDRCAEIFGFDTPVRFEMYLSRVHPDDHNLIERAKRDIKQEQQIFYEIRLLMPDQSTRWVRINAKVFFDEVHQRHRWIGSVEDVTNEKRSFQQLQETEARFRTLVTETPEIASALYVGPDIRIQFVNQVMLKFWGKDESIIGKTFIEALPETADQPFYDQLRNVYTTGNSYSTKENIAMLNINGALTPRYYNDTYKALRNPSGEIYGIYHMAIDVTDQVLAKQHLIQSEETVRQLFMQTPVGIGVLKGNSLTIDLVNDAMLAYWKRTREEVINRPLWEVFPEIASQGFDKITEKVFATGEAYYSPETPVEMLRNGKLELLYIHFAFQPLRDRDGNVSGMLTMGNDVTDLVIARKKTSILHQAWKLLRQ